MRRILLMVMIVATVMSFAAVAGASDVKPWGGARIMFSDVKPW